jgi:malate synthase
MSTTSTSGVTLHGELGPDAERVLTPDALALVADLHRTFNHEREALLRRRLERQDAIAKGGTLDFLPETKEIRDGDWKVADPHPAYLDRRVEITGPTSRKMVINALNSGAKGFMADFEDANSPTGPNMVSGQANLTEAIEGTIEHSENGKDYALDDEVATLLIRPRGWHLIDRHLKVDGGPVSGSLMDAGLYLFHNAQRLLDKGKAPLLYLPKMESHLEARLWNSVFERVQDAVGVPRGSVRATVLIETIPAAFEMDEILYELRDHSGGLNAGRWDYIFSFIKTFRERPEAILPDRAQVTMTVPFMRAYTELLVQTCHKRGAFAMGGMAAFIPSRKNEEINEKAFKQVGADKEREANDGFDGSWVAHPDSVPVAMAEFDKVLGDRPNQIDKQRPDVQVTAKDLLDASSAGGEITEAGLRANVNIGIQYISSWLRGNGAAAIFNLMEDAATAEISRSQVWQWLRHGVTLSDTGEQVTPELVRRLEDEELEKIRRFIDDDEWFETQGRPTLSRELFERVALADEFLQFLTIPAYDVLED